VLTKDGANEKQAKVAIPDLQPGDIMIILLQQNSFLPTI
jgi:hypothetical protein